MRVTIQNLLFAIGAMLLLLGGCSMDSDLRVLWVPILQMVAGGLILWGAYNITEVEK